MKEDEKWAPVLGYEDAYLASSLGNIKSLIGNTSQPNNIVKQSYKRHKKKTSPEDFEKYHDYRLVFLWNTKLKKHVGYQVHRLVWEAFNGNIPDGVQVNHINEIKDDNRLSNLNLMTAKENANYGTRTARGAEKQRYSKLDVQVILDSKFNKNISIISYNGSKEISTFKCNTCDDVFEQTFDNEQQRNGNGCLNCGRLARLAKQFKKHKVKLNNRFNGNIIFTDTKYAGCYEQSNFKCLACGAEFTKSYHIESQLRGNGHPRCPKIKK